MKERLTGAIILVVLIVLLVPELLSGPSRSAPAPQAAAPSTEEPPLRSYTINLADDAHSTGAAAGTSSASAQASGPAQPTPIAESATAGDARRQSAYSWGITDGVPVDGPGSGLSDRGLCQRGPRAADPAEFPGRREPAERLVATAAESRASPWADAAATAAGRAGQGDLAAAIGAGRSGDGGSGAAEGAAEREVVRRAGAPRRIGRRRRARRHPVAGWCSWASFPSRRTQSVWRRS